jgi:hypothetical protein
LVHCSFVMREARRKGVNRPPSRLT